MFSEDTLPYGVRVELLPLFRPAAERDLRIVECSLSCSQDSTMVAVSVTLADGSSSSGSFAPEELLVEKTITAEQVLRSLTEKG